MDIFYNISEIAATLVENYIIIYFLYKYFSPKEKNNKRAVTQAVIVYVILSSAIIIMNYFFIFESFVSIIPIVICYIYVIVFLNGNIGMKLVVPFALFISIFLINMLTTLLFQVIFHKSAYELMSGRDVIRLLSLVITKLFFWLCAIIILHVLKRKVQIIRLKDMMGLFLNFFFSLVCGLLIVEHQLKYPNHNEYTIFLAIILSLVIINVTTFQLLQRIATENDEIMKIAIAKSHLEEQKKNIDIITDTCNELRNLKHDINNYLLSSIQLIKEGKTNSAIDYLEKIANEKYGVAENLVNTEVDSLNAIMNLKILKCNQYRIKIDWEITGSIGLFNDVNLTILIANLLDHAIETSMMAESPSIQIKIYDKDQNMNIVITNNIKLTKNNSHQQNIGLQSAKDIINLYKGKLDINTVSNQMITEVQLNIIA